ncbi:nucleotidyltransferase domain-containing protein [Roseiarcus sp.]|uniref:nucleotidyltransferase domain-containing protein n=1 Tax=Roseiarcus sp. TaxID=1969460 RepID=UPI003C70A1C6
MCGSRGLPDRLWYSCAMNPLADPILARLRALLEKAYGARIERLVLFGSRARGDARPDSDYDVAVFLTEPESFWKESGRLAEIGTDILYDTGAVINALPFKAGVDRDEGPLMRELARDGREL